MHRRVGCGVRHGNYFSSAKEQNCRGYNKRWLNLIGIIRLIWILNINEPLVLGHKLESSMFSKGGQK